MPTTGRRITRAVFADAMDEIDEARALTSAPDPNLARADPDDPERAIKPGQWDGFPDNAMPPHCPFTVIGRDTDGTVYCVAATGHLRAMTKFDDTTIGDLAAPLINDARWAWPAWSKEKRITDGETGEVTVIPPRVVRLETKSAGQAIIQEAARKPDFDPRRQHRGRGGWRLSDDGFLWHSGRWLWRSDKGRLVRAAPTMHDGYLYTRQTPTIEPWREPVEAADSPAQRILADLKTWNWSRGFLDPVLVLGWLVTALMGGALKARPIVFTTGGAGVGKSTLHELVKGVLAGTVFATVDTTAAGIYQHIKQDSLPVLVDELEAKAGSHKAQTVIELMRVAYTGGDVARGGQDHDGTLFTMRSAFFGSAINPPPLLPQDVSRMALLNLSPLDARVAAEARSVTYADHDGRMLLRQVLDGWPRFNELLQTYWAVLHAQKLDSRAIDTYGTLMAAAELAVGQDALLDAGLPADDPEALGQMIASATAFARAQELQNWHKCIDWLLQAPIEGWRGGERLTVGGVLGELRGDDPDGERLSLHHAQKRLYHANLTVRDKGKPFDGYQLAVPKDGPQLRRLFADTEWYGSGWWHALQQAPDSIVHRGSDGCFTNKINGAARKTLLVDLDAFDAYVAKLG